MSAIDRLDEILERTSLAQSIALDEVVARWYRQDVPALVAALAATLRVHQREVLAVDEGYTGEAWCPACAEHYPCETVAVIETHLGGEAWLPWKTSR